MLAEADGETGPRASAGGGAADGCDALSEERLAEASPLRRGWCRSSVRRVAVGGTAALGGTRTSCTSQLISEKENK